MADAIVQEPAKQITTDAGGGGKSGLFSDSLRKELGDAMQAKAADADKTQSAVAATSRVAEPAPDKAKAEADAKAKADAAKAAEDARKLSYPRSAIQWEEWKKAERDRLEKEFSDKFKAAPVPDPKALEDLRKERDDYAARLRSVAIERDPAFEREFQQASGAVVEMIKSNVGVAKADEAEKILAMSPSEARDTAIEKFMENLPAYKQTQFGYALAEMDKLRHVKASKISEAQANWDKLQAEARTKQESERRQMQQAFDKTLAQWSDKDKGLPVLQKRDGDDAWNVKVDESTQLARDIFAGELGIDELAKASIWAATAPLLLEDNAALLKKIEGLETELKKFTDLTPGADGKRGAETPGATDGDVPAGLNYGQAIAHQLRKAGVPMP